MVNRNQRTVNTASVTTVVLHLIRTLTKLTFDEQFVLANTVMDKNRPMK